MRKTAGKRLGRLVRAALILFISLVVGSSAYSLNARHLAGNAMPMPLGFGFSVVLTGSMEPTLKVNDLVLVVETDDYGVGDVVVYQEGTSTLVIHRVIAMGEGWVQTKGDANNAADEPISPDRVKGKMIWRAEFLGYVAQCIRSVPGVITILALAAFLMHRSWRNEKQEKEAELDELRQEILRLQIEQMQGAQPPAPAPGQAELAAMLRELNERRAAEAAQSEQDIQE